jgi:hypothetical protein
MLEIQEPDPLISDFKELLVDLRDRLEPRFRAIENDMRALQARSSRPPVGIGGVPEGESIGALVTRDSRFLTLQTAGRGIAQVTVNRRLVETKSTIVLSPTLKPGTQVLPVAPLPGPAPVLADLIPSRLMSEGNLMFVRAKAPHPIAGVQVHQGDVKAEGDLALETITLAPSTLAIWIAASRQALRDVAGLQLLINSELLYAVKTLEEKEILNGDGSEGHVLGILPQATVLLPTTGDRRWMRLPARSDSLPRKVSKRPASSCILPIG